MGLSPESVRGIHLALLVLALSFCAVIGVGYLSQNGHLAPEIAGAMSFLVSCPYRAMTGAACPFCGTTTAFLLLLQGEITASLSTNPTAMAATPAILVQLVYRPFRIWRPAFNRTEETLLAALCLAAALAVFGFSVKL